MRGGKDLSAGLKKLVDSLDRKGGAVALQSRVGAVWPSIAGPAVMKHTTGAYVRGSELVIFVDSSVWATELQAMSQQYLDAIKRTVGKVPVSRIVFTVSRKVAEEHKLAAAAKDLEDFYAEDRVASVPLSEVERAQVEASASRIPDPSLREAVLRATIADLEWKKGIAAKKER